MEENGTKNTLAVSQELDTLMDFIKNDLSKELPTLTVDLNYFLLGSLIQKNNNLYKRLDMCMTTITMNAIYNSFYQVVSSEENWMNLSRTVLQSTGYGFSTS